MGASTPSLSVLAAACLLACGLSSPLGAQVPAGAAGTVTIPLAEYDRLVERAARPAPPPLVAPLPSAVARADLALRVTADALRGTISLQGEVFRDGVARVPLLRGGTLTEATSAGAPLAVISEGGTTAALLKGPAPFALSLSWAADLASEPGRAVAMLPTVLAGSVRATVDLPGDNPDVRVEPGLVASRSSAGGRTRVELTLQPGTPARLSWSSRDNLGARPVREVRLVSEARSLVTIGESEVRLGTLFDVTVTQGDPDALVVLLPDGFEVTSLTGASVEAGTATDHQLRLAVREPSRRRHQFLVALEKTVTGGVSREEVSLPGLAGVQREAGEVALEAVGTVELTAAEQGALRRLDVGEVSRGLSTLARTPLLSAFRYQRRESERVALPFEVKRFATASVLAAAADEATVTTLVTTEGRALTEVSLTVRNQGQLFLKVRLPAGASLLSAEVAGQAVKPVEGTDGSRVPLVRPGFLPAGPYQVSFVYLATGTPLGKKGAASLSLASMDIPIDVVSWEVFVPDRYEVKRFEGDVILRDRAGSIGFVDEGRTPAAADAQAAFASPAAADAGHPPLADSEVGGVVTDTEGGVLPGASVVVSQGRWSKTVVTDSVGRFTASDVPAGPVTVTAALAGFTPARVTRPGPGGLPVRLSLAIAALKETVQVSAESPLVEGGNERRAVIPLNQATSTTDEQRARQAVPSQAASANVFNLQRRVSGVLPVRIDVPRSGQSYHLVRPLVVDEPTLLKFDYKRR